MEYITIIKAFLSNLNSKMYIYGGLFIAFVLSVFFSYQIGNSKGYTNGVTSEKLKLDKEYSELMDKKLKENTRRLQNQLNLALESEKKKTKVETIYKDREIRIKEIVKSPNISNPVCKLTKEQIDEINSITGEIE